MLLQLLQLLLLPFVLLLLLTASAATAAKFTQKLPATASTTAEQTAIAFLSTLAASCSVPSCHHMRQSHTAHHCCPGHASRG
jgi:hypothetical protein